MSEVMKLMQDLASPFRADEIDWRASRAGMTNGGKAWVKVLAYMDSRAVMNRLDQVLGIDGWYDRYRTGPDGGVVCALSVRMPDGTWVTKEDGAPGTDIEKVKGGISASLKRAVVKFGVGRYLYDLEEGFGVIVADRTKGAKSAKVKGPKGDTYISWVPPELPPGALPGTQQGETPYVPFFNALGQLVSAGAEEAPEPTCAPEVPTEVVYSTAAEQKRIMILSKELGLDDEARHDAMQKLYGVDSVKLLMPGQAKAMIERLTKAVAKKKAGGDA